ncbi:hypothetical protein Syun_024505 [Stephania yunnanensis]|uniref:Fe2OG dioxygenase domain-containing protein n=1 Tax=Stephania yunnanensis TaxID=152371 RepID=A0AAP0I4J0_9MAGN
MYGEAQISGSSDRTAFRRAEKKYKLFKTSLGRRKSVKPVDLSEVFDFRAILESYNRDGGTPDGIVRHRCGFDLPVFGFEDRPGFYFIPGALSVEEQCHWIKESLLNFPQPPNRTNHTAIYGPIHQLFIEAQKKRVLIEADSLDVDVDSTDFDSINANANAPKWQFCEEGCEVPKAGSCRSISACSLLRKLRWSTLGLQFDWSKRNYDVSLPHNKFPESLHQLAKRMAVPAMSEKEEFRPEAAIVNYFGSGDMLGGHLDDMEADWSKPIVSMSLGCKAIFLLGGNSKEDFPVAMFLRSGDIVLMAGQARECFHGVPRIFTDEENAEISPLVSQLSRQDDLCFLDYIRTSRININIRQVF